MYHVPFLQMNARVHFISLFSKIQHRQQQPSMRVKDDKHGKGDVVKDMNEIIIKSHKSMSLIKLIQASSYGRKEVENWKEWRNLFAEDFKIRSEKRWRLKTVNLKRTLSLLTKRKRFIEIESCWKTCFQIWVFNEIWFSKLLQHFNRKSQIAKASKNKKVQLILWMFWKLRHDL